MKDLLCKFTSFLPETLQTSAYHSMKLQQRLTKHFGGKIIVQSQHGQGKSNILLASNLSLIEATKAISDLQEEINPAMMNIRNSCFDNSEIESESSVLYKAANILRNKISNVHIPDDRYPSSLVDRR